jgi:DNA-binding Lrp family transcriptional regulator
MDDIDRQILVELQRDGRITQEQLGKKLGLSRAAAARRLSMLLAHSGFRVIGLVHPAILGLPVMAHVSVSISGQVEEVTRVMSLDRRIPFVSITAGSMSVVAEIRVRSHDELQACLGSIREMRGVRSLNTSTYTALEVDVLPTVHLNQVKVDDLDLELIEVVRGNGRATYAGMAEQVGVPTGTARTRVRRLLDSGIVRIGTMWRPEAQANLMRVGVGININGPLSIVRDHVVKLPGLTFLASAIGRHDLLATVHGNDLQDVLTILNAVRRCPGVQHLETWVHLKVAKEHH